MWQAFLSYGRRSGQKGNLCVPACKVSGIAALGEKAYNETNKGDESMVFSEKLLQLRRQKGWSQEELAEQLQVSRQAVSRWKAGSAMPDVVNLMRIAKLFAISLDELVSENEQENKIQEISTSPATFHDKRCLVAAICFYFSAFCFMVSYEKQGQILMLGLGIVLLVPGSVLLYVFLKG